MFILRKEMHGTKAEKIVSITRDCLFEITEHLFLNHRYLVKKKQANKNKISP